MKDGADEEIYYTYGGSNGVDKILSYTTIHGWASRQMECSTAGEWMV